MACKRITALQPFGHFTDDLYGFHKKHNFSNRFLTRLICQNPMYHNAPKMQDYVRPQVAIGRNYTITTKAPCTIIMRILE